MKASAVIVHLDFHPATDMLVHVGQASCSINTSYFLLSYHRKAIVENVHPDAAMTTKQQPFEIVGTTFKPK